MSDVNEPYVVDEKGKKRAVLPDIEDYQKILRDLEELEFRRSQGIQFKLELLETITEGDGRSWRWQTL